MNELKLTTEDYFINILQEQKISKQTLAVHEERIADHSRRLKEIEENTPINPGLNNFITKLRRSVIVSALGGKESKAYRYMNPEGSRYKTLAGECFAEAERRFKASFNLRSYAELRQHQYEEAVLFWENFELSNQLQLKINQINDQLVLFETKEA